MSAPLTPPPPVDTSPPLALRHQAVRYAVLSVISFVGNLALMVALHEWAGLSAYHAVPIAMACITTFNFYGIFQATFCQQEEQKRQGKR